MRFEYHQKLHHSQTQKNMETQVLQFEYHQKLHHSQTLSGVSSKGTRLSTIRNYITLKPQIQRLSTNETIITIA